MSDPFTTLVLLAIVVAAAALVWLGVARRCPRARTAYAVYVISYFTTSALGATILALPGGVELLAEVNPTANLYVISGSDELTLWLLVYSPFVVPGLVVILGEQWCASSSSRPPSAWLIWFSSPVDLLSFWIVTGLTIGYCSLVFFKAGRLNVLSEILNMSNDYGALIELRVIVFSELGQILFGLVYVGLPSLCFVALYRAVLTKSNSWLVTCVGISCVTLMFQLMTVQKSIAVVFLLSLTLAIYKLGVIRSWYIPFGAGLSLVMLTWLQELAVADWSIVDSLTLIAYRMAVGTVAYVKIFPSMVDYLGIDLMLDVLGFGQSSDAGLIVFDYLYPSVIGVQGYAPAPAHIAAYAEGGVLYSLFALVLIGWFIRFSGNLSFYNNFPRYGALMYAIYMQSIVIIYYLSQTSWRNVLISSYGIIWMFVVLSVFPMVRRRVG